jgi:LmbE family N-acetylglucosaminyl deacetylase
LGRVTFPPSPPPLPDVARVLCVFAHPDDIDFGCAGTVARWIDEGLDVGYLVVTRGDAGGFDDAVPRERMPALREAEQRAAAAAVGVKQVEFLDGYPDGTLTPTLDLRRDIAAGLRRFRPDRVVTNSPLRRWDRLTGPSHPDHLAVGEATTCAVYPDARNAYAFPELRRSGLEPWTVREIWYTGSPNPDHYVDITATYDRKLAALRAHETQTSHRELDAFLRPWLSANAKMGGLPDGTLAEAFTIVRSD